MPNRDSYDISPEKDSVAIEDSVSSVKYKPDKVTASKVSNGQVSDTGSDLKGVTTTQNTSQNGESVDESTKKDEPVQMVSTGELVCTVRCMWVNSEQLSLCLCLF